MIGAYAQSLLVWLFERDFRVSSGTFESCRGSFGANFENSEIASPVYPGLGFRTIATEAFEPWSKLPVRGLYRCVMRSLLKAY